METDPARWSHEVLRPLFIADNLDVDSGRLDLEASSWVDATLLRLRLSAPQPHWGRHDWRHREAHGPRMMN